MKTGTVASEIGKIRRALVLIDRACTALDGCASEAAQNEHGRLSTVYYHLQQFIDEVGMRHGMTIGSMDAIYAEQEDNR